MLLESVIEMKPRMTENHYKFSATSPQASGDKAADELEEMINGWALIMEQRLQAGHQDQMADGQLIDSDAILHLYREKDAYPDIPDYEFMDEDTDGFEENPDFGADRAARRRRKSAPEGASSKPFREKEARRIERLHTVRARAGCPYQIDVVDRAKFNGVRDKLGGFAFGAIIEEQGFWQYDSELRSGDQLQIQVEQGKKMAERLRVYGAEKRFEDDHTANIPKNLVRAHLMTRDSWYELVAVELPSGDERWEPDDWEIVKSADHTFGIATFFPASALTFNGGNNIQRDMPALEALFRLKPSFDRILAITRALAETFATNEMVIERGPKAEDQTDSRGNLQEAEESSDGVKVMPKDWHVSQVGVDINAGWMRMMDEMVRQLENATPPTGVAATSASSQPWTVQLNQAQAAILTHYLINKQTWALTACYQAMLRDMSLGKEAGGLADEFFSYKVDGKGVVNPKQLIGIKAKDIGTLQVGVEINAVTAAEQLTLTMHGLDLVERGAIHKRDFQENFRHQENPAEYMLDMDAAQQLETLKPSIMALRLTETYGSEIVVGADLDLFSADIPNGGVQPVDINNALGESGIRPLEPTIGDLAPSTPEGVIPQQPVVG